MAFELLSSTITALVGSGAGTAIVALLFKRRFDHELELQRAILQRASRVHERQVETLLKLDHHLRTAHAYLQLMSKSAIFKGEDPATYPGKFQAAIGAARDELAATRLLLPREVVAQVDQLFRKISEGQLELSFFFDRLSPSGPERAKYWERAQAIAYEELPRLLDIVEAAAREVIHGPELT